MNITEEDVGKRVKNNNGILGTIEDFDGTIIPAYVRFDTEIDYDTWKRATAWFYADGGGFTDGTQTITFLEDEVEDEENFKVGDTVKVVKEVSYQEGWDNRWVNYMDSAIGNEYVIQEICPSSGVKLLLGRCSYRFPTDSLELVNDAQEFLTTQESIMGALISGETLIDEDGDAYFIKDGAIYFATPDNHAPARYIQSLGDLVSYSPKIYKETPWYENIPEQGVLCWSDTDKKYLVIIVHYDKDKIRPFDSAECGHYDDPVPLTIEEISQFLPTGAK